MKNTDQIFITKASGEVVPFSESKLRTSLERSGASKEQINNIIFKVKEKLFEGISTKKIYRLAFNMLRGTSKHVAAKYHLKRGIMELGPAGYGFEKFIGEILRHQGYAITLGEIVQGECVSHEIDVIAEKENNHFMIECKYHNLPGKVSDVKIPLYIQARFKDVELSWKKLPGHKTKFHQGWVVTNTRFTGDAIQYGNCAGLNLIGWNYPEGKSLRNQIDDSGLYPLTCLTSLTKVEKQKLLDQKIVLCKELYQNKDLLINSGIKPARVPEIMKEVFKLCEQVMTANKES